MSFLAPANFRQLPSTWEMAQPFHIDSTGAVAFDFDPASWARNHILALLLTNPGERVMRYTYGVGIPRMIFENDSPLVEQQMTAAINQGLAIWEPNIIVQTVQFVQQPQYSGIMELDIQFTVGNNPTTHTMAVTLGGTAVEIAAT